MFPYRCETFTTANVSVLNVFKTSVDTINASSITSDMTIGANLNGGSLTLGTANADTSIAGKIIRIADTGVLATRPVFIAAGTNATGSEMFIGSETLGTTNIRGKDVNINYQQGTPQAPVYTYIGNDTAGSTNIAGQTNIANTGLSTNDGVNIATNGFGTSSYVTIGSANFPQIYMRSFNTRINDDGGNCYLGKDNSGRVELRGSIVVLNGQGGDLNLGGVSSGTINLYRPLSIIYPGINYNLNTIGGTYIYASFYNLTFPSATRVAFGCTPILPIGVYALSGFINFGGVGQGTIGFINLVTANSTVSNGATTGFSDADNAVFYGQATWPGPGNGATQVNASDTYILSISKCLALQVYITSGSNPNQASCKFTVTRIG